MRFLFSLLLSLFFISSIAAEQQSSPADAAPVRIGCTISVPPFVILENDRGITLDILRQAFRNVGREVEMSYAPNADNISAFSSDRLDGLCVTNERESSLALFSKYPLVSFHNTVISLQKNNININQVTDLESYSTLAFNMAKTLLSEEFFNVSQKMPEYAEIDDQQKQVQALFNDETEVIIMEQTVFRYYLSQLRRANPNDESLRQAYVVSDIFEPTVYYPAFRSEALRDQYDQGFEMLLEGGDDKKIINEYNKLLDHYLFNQSRLEYLLILNRQQKERL